MNAIIGFTSLATTHINNTEQVQDYLGKIITYSQHLLSLINDVLDMSRIESGTMKIEEKTVFLPELMHNIRTITQAGINAKQIDFYIDTEDIVNETVITDSLRLNQILLNILSNSIKFTPTGGRISLHVIQEPDAPEGYADYKFIICDNGIGMSDEFQKHIFEAFARESTSTVSGIQGTGLGMAITKNIVDMMHGTIRVNSTEKMGSKFTVSLRFAIGEDSVASMESIPALEGSRALIADDDTDACRSVSKMLHKIGMRPEWTISGKEAVLRAEDAMEMGDEFSLYIIDWLMPDMNGIETVRRIRRVIGDQKPIIILTAYDWTDIEEEAREAGVTAFCSKPLFLSELHDLLSKSFYQAASSDGEPSDGTHSDSFAYNREAEDFTGKKILLVEDNTLNQEIATAILTDYGFIVDTAADGVEAVNIMSTATEDNYDLILMDIQMPTMNGYTATMQIRALDNPVCANIPIIAMTANAFEEDRQAALAAGMNDYITKPIDITALMDILHRELT